MHTYASSGDRTVMLLDKHAVVKQIETIYTHILYYSGFNAILAIIAIILMMVELLIVWQPDPDDGTLVGHYEPSPLASILKASITVVSMLSVYVVYEQYSNKVQLSILARGSDFRTWNPGFEGIFQSKLFTEFMIEIMVCLIHIPPGFDWIVIEDDGEESPWITDKYNLLIFLRLYLVVQFVICQQDVFKCRYEYVYAYPGLFNAIPTNPLFLHPS